MIFKIFNKLERQGCRKQGGRIAEFSTKLLKGVFLKIPVLCPPLQSRPPPRRKFPTPLKDKGILRPLSETSKEEKIVTTFHFFRKTIPRQEYLRIFQTQLETHCVAYRTVLFLQILSEAGLTISVGILKNLAKSASTKIMVCPNKVGLLPGDFASVTKAQNCSEYIV